MRYLRLPQRESAQMARYRFHATNGYECVFDALGKDIRAPERLMRRAEEVAQDVMRSLDDQADWSDCKRQSEPDSPSPRQVAIPHRQ